MASEVSQEAPKVPKTHKRSEVSRISHAIRCVSYAITLVAAVLILLDLVLSGDLRSFLIAATLSALLVASKKAKAAPLDLRVDAELTLVQTVLATMWGMFSEHIVPMMAPNPNATRDIIATFVGFSSSILFHIYFDLNVIHFGLIVLSLVVVIPTLVVVAYAVYFHFEALLTMTFKSLPPGPSGIPFYGILLEIVEFKSFLKVNHEVHGDVISFSFGNGPCMSLAKYEDIREVAKGKEFTRRPNGSSKTS